MSQNANAFDDESFDPQDDFLEAGEVESSQSDPFLDAESVERRLLGETEDDFAQPAAEDPFETQVSARSAPGWRTPTAILMMVSRPMDFRAMLKIRSANPTTLEIRRLRRRLATRLGMRRLFRSQGPRLSAAA